jgi:hypothetical protein
LESAQVWLQIEKGKDQLEKERQCLLSKLLSDEFYRQLWQVFFLENSVYLLQILLQMIAQQTSLAKIVTVDYYLLASEN